MTRRLVPLVALALVGCSVGARGDDVADATATTTATATTAATATATTSATATPAPTTTDPPPDGPVTLTFAGDVHTAGRLAARFREPGTALGPVAPLLSGADLTMVNLETAVTDRGRAEAKTYTFRAPPSVFDALRAAGVDVVSMANNHAVDFGPVGLGDSLDASQERGFPVVGLGRDDAAAFAPFLTTLHGERIAVLGATQVADETVRDHSAGPGRPGVASAFDTDRLVQAVRSARQEADTVVVYLHWGVEGQPCPSQRQRDLAAQLSEAGADVLVGTHAHQLQGAGWLGDTYVAYGLGNFVWYSSNSPTADATGVLDLTVDDGRVLAAEFVPARIDRAGLPQRRTGADAERARAAFAELRSCAGLTNAPS